MNIVKLNWDSDFFKINIGKAEVLSYEDEISLIKNHRALKNDYDLLYVLSENPVFQKDWILVDQKVVFYGDTKLVNSKIPSNILPYNSECVNDQLLDLAFESGKYSRFNIDKNFPIGSFERLYTRWIENSINGKLADIILCSYDSDFLAGMVTLKKSDIGKVGLIAVSKHYQSKGIGTTLLNSAKLWLNANGISNIEIATQLANENGCAFYKKNGLVEKSLTNIYHWWL